MAVTGIRATSDNAGNTLIGVTAQRQPWAGALIKGDAEGTMRREWLKVRHTRPTGTTEDENYDATQWSVIVPKGEKRPIHIGGIDEAAHGCQSFFALVTAEGVSIISRKVAEARVIGTMTYKPVEVQDCSTSDEDPMPF